MAHYKYQDYRNLKDLFRSYLNDETLEMSRELKRLFWREIKRLQREAQALRAGGGEDGARVPLSLEQQMELGRLPADPCSVESLVETAERFHALHEAVRQLDAPSRRIVELYSRGCSEREIGRVTGACQSTVHYRKRAAFRKLRTALMDDDRCRG